MKELSWEASHVHSEKELVIFFSFLHQEIRTLQHFLKMMTMMWPMKMSYQVKDCAFLVAFVERHLHLFDLQLLVFQTLPHQLSLELVSQLQVPAYSFFLAIHASRLAYTSL